MNTTMQRTSGVRRWATILAAAAILLAGSTAQAQKRKPKPIKPKKPVPSLVGAKEVATIAPARGFVDSPFAFDGAGGRVVYVASDAVGRSELKVLDLAQQGAELVTVDITSSITMPIAVEFALDGAHYFVVGKKSIDEPTMAIIVNDKGKVVRKFGPAQDIRLSTYRGERVVVTHQAVEQTSKKKQPMTRHLIEVKSAATGKRIGKKAVLDANEAGYIKSLDFRIAYWSGDFTRLVGIKGGEWDKKEDQRSPDTEGWYDVPAGVFERRLPIPELVEHTRRMTQLAEHSNQPLFAVVASDLSGVDLVTAETSTRLELAQPIHHYDHKSMVYHSDEWGNLYFTLTIDSVNADAVARQKADVDYLDLYMVAAGTNKAVRKARLRSDKRRFLWRATGEHWLVVERHIGFERGGKRMVIYRFDK